MLTMCRTVWRYWPLGTAAAWGAGATAVLTALWVTSDRHQAGDLIAAASNGLMLFFLVGGVGVIDNMKQSDDAAALHALDERSWVLPLVPAAATAAALLPVRLAAVAGEIDGPWSSVPESTLDIAMRATVVYVASGVMAARG